jgi:hypothetical protein
MGQDPPGILCFFDYSIIGTLRKAVFTEILQPAAENLLELHGNYDTINKLTYGSQTEIKSIIYKIHGGQQCISQEK